MAAAQVRDRIVVGVDGSTQSLTALDFAAREAERTGSDLDIVHAWLWPLFTVSLGPAPGAREDSGLQAQSERILTDAEAAAREVAPSTTISRTLLAGDPVMRLLSRAEGARMIVVGNRGLGGFGSLLLGSVGLRVAAHARCPAVIVRGAGTVDGPVVVGVDGSDESDAAVTEAFREAASRRTGVVAVHTWSLPLRIGDPMGGGYPELVDEAERAGRLLLDKALTVAREQHPDVPVEVRLIDGSAAGTLVEASHGAALVTVGSRGAGALRGLLLGSVAQALLHHATSPVLVCPPAAVTTI